MRIAFLFYVNLSICIGEYIEEMLTYLIQRSKINVG